MKKYFRQYVLRRNVRTAKKNSEMSQGEVSHMENSYGEMSGRDPWHSGHSRHLKLRGCPWYIGNRRRLTLCCCPWFNGHARWLHLARSPWHSGYPDPSNAPSLTDTLARTVVPNSTDDADCAGNPDPTDTSSSTCTSLSTKTSGPIDIPSRSDAPEADSETNLVYYKNQYNASYKTDERVCNRPKDKLKPIVYYKKSSISSIVTKNYQFSPIIDFQKTNLVHKFVCNKGWCERLKYLYVGVTKTTLSTKVTMHQASGAPKTHYNQVKRIPRGEHKNCPQWKWFIHASYHRCLNHPNQIVLNLQSRGKSRTLKLTSHQPREEQQPTSSNHVIPHRNSTAST